MSLPEPFTTTARVLALIGALLTACGSTDTPSDGGGGTSNPACGKCAPPDTTLDLMTPAVSFKIDVFPIFRMTCNRSVCHGQKPGTDPNGVYPAADLYLGPPFDDKDRTPIDAALLSTVAAELRQPSKEAPPLDIVSPGDPSASFVVDKLYACQNAREMACTVVFSGPRHCPSSACGDPMPPRDEPAQLSEEQRTTIRRWIAQGAQDN
jgi:hypothetical protein